MPYDAGVDGKRTESTNPWAWLSALSIQVISSKALSGSRQALVIARNEPPMFDGPPGELATRHLPLVFGVSSLMSPAAQEAFSWLGSRPLSVAAMLSGVPLTIFETRPRRVASTARFQAVRT